MPLTRAMKASLLSKTAVKKPGAMSGYIWPLALVHAIHARMIERQHYCQFVKVAVVGMGATDQHLSTFNVEKYIHLVVDITINTCATKENIKGAVFQFCNWFQCTFIDCPKMGYLVTSQGKTGGVTAASSQKVMVRQVVPQEEDMMDIVLKSATTVQGGTRVTVPIALDRVDVSNAGPDIDGDQFEAEALARTCCHPCTACKARHGY